MTQKNILNGITAYRYPLTLGDNPNISDYIMITINVNEKFYGRDAVGASSLKSLSLDESQISNYHSAVSKTGHDKLFSYGGARVAAKASDTLATKIKTLSDAAKQSNILGVADFANFAANTSIVQDMLPYMNLITDEIKQAIAPVAFKKIKNAILLPMPLRLSTNYGVNYSDANLSGIMGALASTAGAGALRGSPLAQQAALDVTKIAAAQLGVDEGIIDKLSGRLTNPRTEQVFKGVDVRKFTFDYLFAFKSITEWQQVDEIIKLIKKNMLPGLQQNGQFWTVPSEFDIDFRSFNTDSNADYEQSASKTHQFLPKITTSVIENINVDYTPHGYWIQTTSGRYPPWLGMTISFRELQPMHAQAIDSGY